MSPSAGWRRACLVASACTYVATLNWTYATLVAPRYVDWGLSLDHPPMWHFIFCCVISVIPSLWLPVGLTRPSQILFLVQYFVLFIPTTFIAYYSIKPSLSIGEAVQLNLMMFAGLSVIQAAYLVPVVRVRTFKMSAPAVSASLAAGFLLLMCYLALAFREVFRLVGFEDIYEVRTAMAAAAARAGTRLGLYAQTWFAGFFLPLFFSMGAFARKRWLMLVAGAGYVFLFGVTGNRTAVAAVILLPLLYGWSVWRPRNAAAVFGLGVSALLAFGSVLATLPFPSVEKWYVATVNFRTFAVPQLALIQHYAFFETHPLTHMSHVTLVNAFVRYPYHTDVGSVIGEYYYGGTLQENTGMWAGDGLAGFGLPGILVMSGVCSLLFWIIDCVAEGFDVRFVVVALGFIAMSFANVSLFTTILSGGLALLLGTLAVIPDAGAFRQVMRPPPVREPHQG